MLGGCASRGVAEEVPVLGRDLDRLRDSSFFMATGRGVEESPVLGRDLDRLRDFSFFMATGWCSRRGPDGGSVLEPKWLRTIPNGYGLFLLRTIPHTYNLTDFCTGNVYTIV